MTTTKCTRCHRTLRSASSIAAKMGRTCARKARQEAAAKLVLASYSPVQVEKVQELLRDGGAVRTGRHTFTVVASDGVRRYDVNATTASCTCKAADNGRRCYHVAAAQGTDRGTVIKAFLRWYIGELNAQLPEPATRKETPDA